MTSAALAILWSVFVLLILVPASTLVAKAMLRLLRPFRDRGTVADAAYLLVVLPTLGPVLWFVSETVHGSEAFLLRTSDTQGFCYDLVVASVLLVGVLAALMARYASAERGRSGQMCELTTERIRSLCETNAGLQSWTHRMSGVQGAQHDSATRGIFSPCVEVDSAFARQLADDALVAVLLHEISHVEKRDPLRNLVGHVCLAVNPLGRWLVPDWQRWRAQRELRCDAAALSAQADPLSLAEALVLAARPTRAVVAARLTGAKEGLLKLRVQRLLEPPEPTHESSYVAGLPLVLFSAELVLPHMLTSAPIQQIHDVAFHPLLTIIFS